MAVPSGPVEKGTQQPRHTFPYSRSWQRYPAGAPGLIRTITQHPAGTSAIFTELQQMVLEATTVAMDEQRAILYKQQAIVGAGVGSPNQDTVTYAARSATYSAEIVACPELIATEPERHYGIFLTAWPVWLSLASL